MRASYFFTALLFLGGCGETVIGATSPAQIQVTDRIDFGDVAVGASDARTLAINNVGGTALILTTVSVEGGGGAFTRAAPPTVVEARGDIELTIRFSPAAVGPASATLLIVTDASNGTVKRVDLVGDGVADGNRPPMVNASIQPASPTTRDALTVTATTSDADGDAVTLRYSWTRDSNPILTASPVIASRETARGQRWMVTITPNDGRVDGHPASAEVVIINALPRIASVAIQPAPASATSDLTARTTGEIDADGDSITVGYEWFVDGIPVQTGLSATLLAGSARTGQSVFVRVVPNDGFDDGAAVDSPTVVIGNSAPSIASVVIGPANPTAAVTITASISGWFDADGDAPGYRHQWRVRGSAVSSASTLTGASFAKGDDIQLFVTPFDGSQEGLTVVSNIITAINTPPTPPVVVIHPAPAVAADDLTCAVAQASTDADGDTISVAFVWTRDGTAAATTAIVSSASTLAGELWTCTVTPNDGEEDGLGGVASVMIGGASPGSWRAMSTSGAPSARDLHSAVWTGTEMIVWGGRQTDARMSGGRYNPALDQWTGMSTAGAPRFHSSGGSGGQTVWTGSEVLAWHGYEAGTPVSGRYNPSVNQWRPMSTVSEPSARRLFPVVWTGTEMIIWGGCDQLSTAFGTGARYNPSADRWTAMSTVGAPSGRCQHAAVWTGSELIIWGGMATGGTDMRTGARYDPVNDTWRSISSTGAPSAQRRPAHVWTGTELIVFGGSPLGSSHGRYNPSSDTWASVASAGAPAIEPRAAAWTGTEMFVFGGNDPAATNACALYDPGANTWRGCETLNAPAPRYLHSVVWTGTEAIVWGGATSGASHHDDGGRYTP